MNFRQISFRLVLFFFVVALGQQATAQRFIKLESGVSKDLRVYKAAWRFLYIDVKDWDSKLVINNISKIKTLPDIYIRFGGLPSHRNYDFHSSPTEETSHEFSLDNHSETKLRSGRCYIGLYGSSHSRITATKYSTTAVQGGMGALPFEGGSAFRVWAPFAESVHVAGEFNDWNSNVAPLVYDGNGHWSMEHRNANPGQKYRYVIRNSYGTHWKQDPREEEVQNSVGDSVIFDNNFNWTDAFFQMPSWNELVVYEMHIGTFFDSPGFGPGNFDSAINRLDHVRDLGCNAICLMPISEFSADFSWGYNPAQPFAVESSYNGPQGLKRFVNAAHERGIAVLVDVVHNHWGPSDLDMWQFDGWSENGRGGIYFYQDGRADTPWGNTRPDYGRGEVRQYIRDNIMQWLVEFHCDGLRWDSVSNTRRTFSGDNPEGYSLMQWINDDINLTQPWAISVAEDLQNNAYVTKSTGEGGLGFDSQWDSNFVHPVRHVMETSNDNDRNMWDLKSAIEFKYNNNAIQRMIYTESHDEVANGRQRVPEEIWPGNAGSWFSRKRSTLGAALVFTSPGIPMIFQGQEVLEDGYFQDTDPVDWTKETTYAGIEQMYTDLIRLRRNWWNQTRGLRGEHVNVFHVNDGAKMLAFHRWDQGGAGDDVVVVLNWRNQEWQDYRIGLPRPGVWRVRFNSDWTGYSPDFGNFWSPDVTADGGPQDGLGFSGSLKIGPYSILILSQD